MPRFFFVLKSLSHSLAFECANEKSRKISIPHTTQFSSKNFMRAREMKLRKHFFFLARFDDSTFSFINYVSLSLQFHRKKAIELSLTKAFMKIQWNVEKINFSFSFNKFSLKNRCFHSHTKLFQQARERDFTVFSAFSIRNGNLFFLGTSQHSMTRERERDALISLL